MRHQTINDEIVINDKSEGCCNHIVMEFIVTN